MYDEAAKAGRKLSNSVHSNKQRRAGQATDHSVETRCSRLYSERETMDPVPAILSGIIWRREHRVSTGLGMPAAAGALAVYRRTNRSANISSRKCRTGLPVALW
jgi:hypothetical protein